MDNAAAHRLQTSEAAQALDQLQPPRFSHPDFSEPVTYRATPRPGDDELATAQTIAEMGRLTREDSRSRTIRELALKITVGLHGPDWERQALARVFRWIRTHVAFRPDAATAAMGNLPEAHQAEVLIRPVDLLAMRQPTGDCDDYSMLCAALLRSVGMRCEFATIAAAEPDVYSHVYVIAVLPDGCRINMDTSHGPEPGWAAPAVGKSRTWSIEPVHSSLNGLADYVGSGEEFPIGTDPISSGGGGIDWNALIQAGARVGGNIATNMTMPPGTYIQNGASVTYRQPVNGTALNIPFASALGTGGSGGTLLLLAAGAVVLLIVLKK